MAISSMTGFARSEGSDGKASWVWEVRSVNSRGLDFRCRLPSGLERLEPQAREAVNARFTRGAVSLNLALSRAETAETEIRINRDLLDRVLALRGELGGAVAKTPPSLEGLLALRGMIETAEDETTEEALKAREKAILASLGKALDAMAAARREEGARLRTIALQHLDELETLAGKAAACAGAQPDAILARLKEQVAELLEAEPALPEERIAQEAVLLATRADVREELDRLTAHIEAGRELLDHAEPVGRRLDFLCQELNREANTLCSKSSDLELTRAGLALKTTIDRLREQVQNIE